MNRQITRTTVNRSPGRARPAGVNRQVQPAAPSRPRGDCRHDDIVPLAVGVALGSALSEDTSCDS